MSKLKFVAAFLAAFTVTDLYLNEGRMTRVALYKLNYEAIRFNQMTDSWLRPFA